MALFLPAVGAVEALELGVAGEQDVDLARKADGSSGAGEEARQAGLRERERGGDGQD